MLGSTRTPPCAPAEPRQASAVFEKSVPVPTEDLEHEAKVGLGWADPQATEATDGLSHPWLDDVG